MGNSNGIISKTSSGISLTADIEYVLQESTSDLGALCTSDNINMWSKAKPIKYASWVSNGGGTVDSDGNPYGLIRPSHDDISQLDSANISYQKPTGGASSPYRALDFDGYDHNCECPWNIVMPPSGSFPLNQSGAVVKFQSKGNLLHSGNVTFADLYAGKYFCVCIGVNGATTYYKTLGANEFASLNFADCPAYANATAGTVLTIRCAMSSKQYSSWQNGGVDAMFYSLSYPGLSTISTLTLYTPASNTYGFTLAGDFAGYNHDRRLITLNNTTNYVGGEFNNAASQTGRLDYIYTLASAQVKAMLHSAPSVVVDSYSLNVADCAPYTLERGDGGYPYTVSFSAPVNISALDLPMPSPGDYYDIRVELTYNR